MPAWDVLSGKQAYAAPAIPAAVSAGEASGWLAVGIAVAIAAVQLFATGLLKHRVLWPAHMSIKALRVLHAGRVGDQVAWLAAGLAMLAGGIVAVSVVH